MSNNTVLGFHPNEIIEALAGIGMFFTLVCTVSAAFFLLPVVTEYVARVSLYRGRAVHAYLKICELQRKVKQAEDENNQCIAKLIKLDEAINNIRSMNLEYSLEIGLDSTRDLLSDHISKFDSTHQRHIDAQDVFRADIKSIESSLQAVRAFLNSRAKL